MTSAAPVTLQDRPEGDIREFVGQLYRTFFRREADDDGLNHYVQELRSGMPVAEILNIFHNSDEYRRARQRDVLVELAASRQPGNSPTDEDTWLSSPQFPEDYAPPGEAGRSYLHRLHSGFLHRYCSGALVLDVGFSGYDNPEGKAALPHAIGIDLDYPGYDGRTLPFGNSTVDTVFSSHCLEHIQYDHAAVRDWFRVLRLGGFIVCIVPSQALYEKRRFLPSRFNEDHKRMYTPSSLLKTFEEALEVNSYRVRHLAENDRGFNYEIGPDTHSDGAYEIEMVIEKIIPPRWTLD
jgi:SAM-dependent methyltransferase